MVGYFEKTWYWKIQISTCACQQYIFSHLLHINSICRILSLIDLKLIWSQREVRMILRMIFFNLIGRVCLRSQNYPNHFISLDLSLQAKILTWGRKKFRLVQALAGNDHQPAVSFHSEDVPNSYLRHRSWFIHADPQSTTKLYKEDASFFVHKSQWFPGYYSFESVNYPGHYIRHQNYMLRISNYDNTQLFQRDASFKIEDCWMKQFSLQWEEIHLQ